MTAQDKLLPVFLGCISTTCVILVLQDDVIKWNHFPRYWTFVWRIRRLPVNSPHKGQWRGALVFSLICAWINAWVHNSEAGDLISHPTNYDVIVMDTNMVLCFPQTIHQVKNWRVVLYPGATIELYPGTTIETIETPYIASVIHACIWPASHSGGAVRIIESLTTMTYSV